MRLKTIILFLLLSLGAWADTIPSVMRDVSPGWGYSSRSRSLIPIWAVVPGGLDHQNLLQKRTGEGTTKCVTNAGSELNMLSTAFAYEASGTVGNPGVAATSLSVNANYSYSKAQLQNKINITGFGLATGFGFRWMGGEGRSSADDVWEVLNPKLRDKLVQMSECKSIPKYLQLQEEIRNTWGDGFVRSVVKFGFSSYTTTITLSTEDTKQAWGGGYSTSAQGALWTGGSRFQSDFKKAVVEKKLQSTTTTYQIPFGGPYASLVESKAFKDSTGLSAFLDGTVSNAFAAAKLPDVVPAKYKPVPPGTIVPPPPTAAQVSAAETDLAQRKEMIIEYNDTVADKDEIPMENMDTAWREYTKLSTGKADINWNNYNKVPVTSAHSPLLTAALLRGRTLRSTPTVLGDDDKQPALVVCDFEVMLWSELFPDVWFDIHLTTSEQQANLVNVIKQTVQLNSLLDYLSFIRSNFPEINDRNKLGITFTETQWTNIDNYLFSNIKLYCNTITNLIAVYGEKYGDPDKTYSPKDFENSTNIAYKDLLKNLKKNLLSYEIFMTWTNNYDFWNKTRMGYTGQVETYKNGQLTGKYVQSNMGSNDDKGYSGLFKIENSASSSDYEATSLRYYPVMSTITGDLNVYIGCNVPTVYVSSDADLNAWPDNDYTPGYWTGLLLGEVKSENINKPFAVSEPFREDTRFYGSGLIGNPSIVDRLDNYKLAKARPRLNRETFDFPISLVMLKIGDVNLDYSSSYLQVNMIFNCLYSLGYMAHDQMSAFSLLKSYGDESLALMRLNRVDSTTDVSSPAMEEYTSKLGGMFRNPSAHQDLKLILNEMVLE